MKNTKKILISILTITIVIFVFFFIRSNIDTKSEDFVDTSNWQIFINNNYSFQLSLPDSGWDTEEFFDHSFSPGINIYKKSTVEGEEMPFTHHTVGVSHISVFPEGIPTEGLFGQTVELPDGWSDKFSENSSLYILADGTPFAAYLQFNETPNNWENYGFVWMYVEVDDYNITCLENEEEIMMENCDPLGNDNIEIIHIGTVDSEAWNIEKEIVESMNFIN